MIAVEIWVKIWYISPLIKRGGGRMSRMYVDIL